MNSILRNKVIRVVSRTSNLALKQVEEVFSQFPDLKYRVLPMESYGDKRKDISLINNKMEDFFTRELDIAILNDVADVSIHSAKDLPYPLPEGLEIIALFEAFDQTDSIVSRQNILLNALPAKPKLGTSSLLRKNELLKIRDDIQIVSIRGTIEERIQQVDEGSVDAVVVATCALKRLGLENRIAEILPFETHSLQGNLAMVAKRGNQYYKELFEKKDIRRNYGKVWLVGFGPGDPGLLTIKGHELLKIADIIFFDDLLNKDFLNQFKAEKIYVGKRKDKHSYEQTDINKLLYKAAISGKQTVRLKGGDPMLFAHGGEEIEYLQKYLVETEVIPGITTAMAASAFTKIPLTNRRIASSVTFITGHSEKDIHVPTSGTLVYYMGASNLCAIASEAIRKGWRPDTPIMLVYNVSGIDQEAFYTTLEQVSLHTQTLKTPLIIIIGDVVRLKWNTAEHLEKPKFLVTGTKPGDFGKYGNVVHQPFIEIKPLEDYNHIKPVLEAIKTFQWLIFTSRYAVEFFFKVLNQFGMDSRSMANIGIASIGMVTTAELLKYGIISDLQPEDESSEGLITLFQKMNLKDQKILIPRSDLGLKLLPEGLKTCGYQVVIIKIYKNVIPEHIIVVKPNEYDYIVFNSPSGLENFFKFHKSIEFNDQKFIVQGIETLKKINDFKISLTNVITAKDFKSTKDRLGKL